ncbi:unnamed protein product [Colias eurytheme]|nr:unnamed protein product [Colias eurytheme]
MHLEVVKHGGSRAGATLDDRFKTSVDAGGVRLTVSAARTGDSGVYTLQASNAAGKDSTRVTLEVSPDEMPTGDDPPTFLRRLQDLTVKVGTRTRFLVEIVSSTECKDSCEIKAGDVFALTANADDPTSLGTYTCEAVNCMGRAYSSSKVHVIGRTKEGATPSPGYHIQEDGVGGYLLEVSGAEWADEGEWKCVATSAGGRVGISTCNVTMDVAIPPEPTVLWYRDDQPVDESSRCHLGKEDRGVFYLDIKNLELMDQTEWKCVAMNDFGHSVTSCFLKLIIPRHFKKPRFLENLQAILSDEGAVNLECKVIGVPQPVLKWYKDGEELKPGDIHRIISGQDGTCCLGTYTCEAQNCMGIAASSASLLGFEDTVKAKNKKKVEEQTLQRNLSLSTIHEERTSQMYDTPVGDITLDDKGEISFSFDGKEVSVSLYETPDLTEEEALQIVEMYADQLSENVTEHNVVELPPLRFVKETSTSGNLLMEAIIIDVSPDYFVAPEEDLRTEADIEDISIAEENGHAQLSFDQEAGEDYLEKTMAMLSEEKSDIPARVPRRKSDSQKSADDYFSLSKDPSLSEEKKDDDTQILSESASFASARSAEKIKSSKPSLDDEVATQASSDVTKTVMLREEHRINVPSEDIPESKVSIDNALNITTDGVAEPEKPIQLKIDPQRLEKLKHDVTLMSSILSRIMNNIQVTERDIILKSQLMSTAAIATKSLEIINSLITPLNEIHSITEAIKESIVESAEINNNLFKKLPDCLKEFQKSLTMVEKCVDVGNDKTFIKNTCVSVIQKCDEDITKFTAKIKAVAEEDLTFMDDKFVSEISSSTSEILNVIKIARSTIASKSIFDETPKKDEMSVDIQHLNDTQKAIYDLKIPLNSLLNIVENALKSIVINSIDINDAEVILINMSASIQDLQTALEHIELLSVEESNSTLHKYNTNIIETVMGSVLKLRSSFESLSMEKEKRDDRGELKNDLQIIKENLNEISAQVEQIENNIGSFDILHGDNKLDVLQKMAHILITLENSLPSLNLLPNVQSTMTLFHKYLTKALENVIESNETSKYLTLVRICDIVNRMNASIKNIETGKLLSLASIGNNFSIIEDIVKNNNLSTDLNNEIILIVNQYFHDIQNIISYTEDDNVRIDFESAKDISNNSSHVESKAVIAVHQIEQAIAVIHKVVPEEATTNINTIYPVLENMCPILEDLKYSIASLRESEPEHDSHLSEMSEQEKIEKFGKPLRDLHENITILNTLLLESTEDTKAKSEITAVVAEPLHELHNTLQILQENVISQYESLSSLHANVDVASTAQVLENCFLIVQEQHDVEPVEEISTLEDISGIKTTAESISSDHLILPTENIINVAIASETRPQSEVFKVLNVVHETLDELEGSEVIKVLESLSAMNEFASLKNVPESILQFNREIQTLLPCDTQEDSISNLKLDSLTTISQTLDNCLSVIENHDILQYQDILQITPDKIQLVSNSLSDLKINLAKFKNLIEDTPNKGLEVSMNTDCIKKLGEDYKMCIKDSAKLNLVEDIFVDDLKVLENSVDNFLMATNTPDSVKNYNNIKVVSEKLYEDILKIQDELIFYTVKPLKTTNQDNEILNIVNELANNLTVMQPYVTDAPHIFDIDCDLFQQCDILKEPNSLKDMEDVIKISIETFKDTTKESPMSSDLKKVEALFENCKSKFSILRYLLNQPPSQKKVIRLLQEYSVLQTDIREFKNIKNNLNLSQDTQTCLDNFLVQIEKSIHKIKTSLIKIVSSLSKTLFKKPLRNIEETLEYLSRYPIEICPNELHEVIQTFYNILNNAHTHLINLEVNVLQEMQEESFSCKEDMGEDIKSIKNFLDLLEMKIATTSNEDTKMILNKMLICIRKHQDYKIATGTGKNMILLKCLSDCSTILMNQLIEHESNKLVTKLTDNDSLQKALCQFMQPLETLHLELNKLKEIKLSKPEVQTIPAETFNSCVQTINQLCQAIDEYVISENLVFGDEELAKKIDVKLCSIQEIVQTLQGTHDLAYLTDVSTVIENTKECIKKLFSDKKMGIEHKVPKETFQPIKYEEVIENMEILLTDLKQNIELSTISITDNVEVLQNILDEFQIEVIKLKSENNSEVNDALTETLNDLECSVRSVQLQVSENSPPEHIMEASATLQLLVCTIKDVLQATESSEIVEINEENILKGCMGETENTIILLDKVSETKKGEKDILNIIKGLNSIKETIKEIKQSFSVDEDTLIDKGVDILQNLESIENQLFAIENEINKVKNVDVTTRDTIVTAVHSVYTSISNMRGTITSIQKRYIYLNYGKPSENILNAIKNINKLSKLDNKNNWIQVSKYLRKTLNHFEDVKFYINLDKTARLPSDATLTKIVLNELKMLITDIILTNVTELKIPLTNEINGVILKVNEKIENIANQSILEVKDKIPIFKEISSEIFEISKRLKEFYESHFTQGIPVSYVSENDVLLETEHTLKLSEVLENEDERLVENIPKEAPAESLIKGSLNKGQLIESEGEQLRENIQPLIDSLINEAIDKAQCLESTKDSLKIRADSRSTSFLDLMDHETEEINTETLDSYETRDEIAHDIPSKSEDKELQGIVEKDIEYFDSPLTAENQSLESVSNNQNNTNESTIQLVMEEEAHIIEENNNLPNDKQKINENIEIKQTVVDKTNMMTESSVSESNELTKTLINLDKQEINNEGDNVSIEYTDVIVDDKVEQNKNGAKSSIDQLLGKDSKSVDEEIDASMDTGIIAKTNICETQENERNTLTEQKPEDLPADLQSSEVVLESQEKNLLIPIQIITETASKESTEVTLIEKIVDVDTRIKDNTEHSFTDDETQQSTLLNNIQRNEEVSIINMNLNKQDNKNGDDEFVHTAEQTHKDLNLGIQLDINNKTVTTDSTETNITKEKLYSVTEDIIVVELDVEKGKEVFMTHSKDVEDTTKDHSGLSSSLGHEENEQQKEETNSDQSILHDDSENQYLKKSLQSQLTNEKESNDGSLCPELSGIHTSEIITESSAETKSHEILNEIKSIESLIHDPKHDLKEVDKNEETNTKDRTIFLQTEISETKRLTQIEQANNASEKPCEVSNKNNESIEEPPAKDHPLDITDITPIDKTGPITNIKELESSIKSIEISNEDIELEKNQSKTTQSEAFSETIKEKESEYGNNNISQKTDSPDTQSVFGETLQADISKQDKDKLVITDETDSVSKNKEKENIELQVQKSEDETSKVASSDDNNNAGYKLSSPLEKTLKYDKLEQDTDKDEKATDTDSILTATNKENENITELQVHRSKDDSLKVDDSLSATNKEKGNIALSQLHKSEDESIKAELSIENNKAPDQKLYHLEDTILRDDKLKQDKDQSEKINDTDDGLSTTNKKRGNMAELPVHKSEDESIKAESSTENNKASDQELSHIEDTLRDNKLKQDKDKSERPEETDNGLLTISTERVNITESQVHKSEDESLKVESTIGNNKAPDQELLSHLGDTLRDDKLKQDKDKSEKPKETDNGLLTTNTEKVNKTESQVHKSDDESLKVESLIENNKAPDQKLSHLEDILRDDKLKQDKDQSEKTNETDDGLSTINKEKVNMAEIPVHKSEDESIKAESSSENNKAPDQELSHIEDKLRDDKLKQDEDKSERPEETDNGLLTTSTEKVNKTESQVHKSDDESLKVESLIENNKAPDQKLSHLEDTLRDDKLKQDKGQSEKTNETDDGLSTINKEKVNMAELPVHSSEDESIKAESSTENNKAPDQELSHIEDTLRDDKLKQDKDKSEKPKETDNGLLTTSTEELNITESQIHKSEDEILKVESFIENNKAPDQELSHLEDTLRDNKLKQNKDKSEKLKETDNGLLTTNTEKVNTAESQVHKSVGENLKVKSSVENNTTIVDVQSQKDLHQQDNNNIVLNKAGDQELSHLKEIITDHESQQEKDNIGKNDGLGDVSIAIYKGKEDSVAEQLQSTEGEPSKIVSQKDDSCVDIITVDAQSQKDMQQLQNNYKTNDKTEDQELSSHSKENQITGSEQNEVLNIDNTFSGCSNETQKMEEEIKEQSGDYQKTDDEHKDIKKKSKDKSKGRRNKDETNEENSEGFIKKDSLDSTQGAETAEESIVASKILNDDVTLTENLLKDVQFSEKVESEAIETGFVSDSVMKDQKHLIKNNDEIVSENENEDLVVDKQDKMALDKVNQKPQINETQESVIEHTIDKNKGTKEQKAQDTVESKIQDHGKEKDDEKNKAKGEKKRSSLEKKEKQKKSKLKQKEVTSTIETQNNISDSKTDNNKAQIVSDDDKNENFEQKDIQGNWNNTESSYEEKERELSGHSQRLDEIKQHVDKTTYDISNERDKVQTSSIDKALIRDKPQFVDPNIGDPSMEFSRPPSYMGKPYDSDANKLLPEVNTYSSTSKVFYKAQSLVRDHQLRSPSIMDTDIISDTKDRSEIRFKSKAMSETRNVSEKRIGSPRDLKRKPVFSTHLTNRTAVEGSRVKLTCSVLSSTEPVLKWYKNGVPIDDKQKYKIKFADGLITMELLNAIPSDSGDYSCTVENEHGSVTTSAKLKVYPSFEPSPIPPTFTRSIRGEELRISAIVEAYPSVGVTWYREGVRLRPSRRAVMTLNRDGQIELALASVTPRDAGVYTCTASNEVGQASTSGKVEIVTGERQDQRSLPTVICPDVPRVEVIPRFEKELTDLLCYDGDAVEFECRISGNPDPDIRWFHYNEVLPDCPDFESTFEVGTARLKIKQVAAEDEGTYTCEASNNLGKASSKACLVVYRPEVRRLRSPTREIAPKFYTYPFNKVVEEGETVVFQCAVGGLPPPWATWDKDGIIITPTSRISIKEKDEMLRILQIDEVTIEDVGLYRITLENDYGRAEASARLEVISHKGKFYGGTRSCSASPRRMMSYTRRTPSYSRQD